MSVAGSWLGGQGRRGAGEKDRIRFWRRGTEGRGWEGREGREVLRKIGEEER